MSNIKGRYKLLTRIAQATPTQSPQSTNISPTTVPVPNFQASAIWGWLNTSYNSNSVNAINHLVNTLNTALHYASAGKFNFQVLKSSNFQVDPSSVPSVDAKNLLNLSVQVYKDYINSGNKFALAVTPQQIQGWNARITGSQAFLNLSQVNAAGPLAQKLPGNLKDNILNDLRLLVSYNPLNQAARK